MARQPSESLRHILEMPPLLLAARFLEIAVDTPPPANRVQQLDAPSIAQRVRMHVETLNISAQHDALGLPQALSGLAILTGITVAPPIQRYADELAHHAVQGIVGTTAITDAWIRFYIELVSGPRDDFPLTQYTLAEGFYQALRYFSHAAQSFRPRCVNGFLFPNLETMDEIFLSIDKKCRQFGGLAIRDWVAAQVQSEAKNKNKNKHKLQLPYVLIAGYAAKYIRYQPSTTRKFDRLENDLRNLYRLLRLDEPVCMGVMWSEPAFVLEDVSRNILGSLFVGSRFAKDSDYIEFADFLMLNNGRADSQWALVKKLYSTPPFRLINPEEVEGVSDMWIHRAPAPNKGFGVSLQSSMRGSAGEKPAIALPGGRFIRIPPVNITGAIPDSKSHGAIGLDFEEFVRLKLKKLGSVEHGKYSNHSGDVFGDVDALLYCERHDTLVLFECKAVTEFPTKWSGGYMAFIDYFKKGFLKSQEQLLRVERVLAEDTYLSLERADRTRWDTVAHRVLRVSVSMRGFGDLHHASYPRTLLSHFGRVIFSIDSGNNLAGEIADTQTAISDHIWRLEAFGIDVLDVYRRAFFLDLGILMRYLERIKTVDELVESLEAEARRDRGFGRIYYT